MTFQVSDWAGLICFLLISFVFYAIRKPIFLYVLLCAGCLLLFVHLTPFSRSDADWWIMMIGLTLYAFGLLIVRVMLMRSVSLHLLARLTGRLKVEKAEDAIADRLHDMRFFRLATVEQNEVYQLTKFGWFIASLVVFTYTVLRISR